MKDCGCKPDGYGSFTAAPCKHDMACGGTPLEEFAGLMESAGHAWNDSAETFGRILDRATMEILMKGKKKPRPKPGY